jgi:hypothetical protein
MNEPKRLIDQCESELEWALLREGRRTTHDEARRMRVLGAVGVGLAVTAGAKTSWALVATWQKLLLGGVAVCSGVGGGVLAVQGYRAMHPAAQVATAGAGVFVSKQVSPRPDLLEATLPVAAADLSRAAVVREGAVPATGESAVSPSRPGVGNETGNGAGAVSGAGAVNGGARAVSGERRASERTTPERGVADRGGSLREEVAVLDRARAAARSGHNAEALTLVDSYVRDFPQGSLRLEAEVVRVQALAAAGRRSEASLRAKKLLAQSPNSVVASRLRGYILE